MRSMDTASHLIPDGGKYPGVDYRVRCNTQVGEAYWISCNITSR